MRNKLIKLLKNTEKLQPVEHYNSLLNVYSEMASLYEVRGYQTGFSEFKYENLKSNLKKKFSISDLDIYHFSEDTLPDEEVMGNLQNDKYNDADEMLKEGDELKEVLLKSLEENKDAQEGLKIRDEYPFLNDANCPEEFWALVGKKITAWANFTKSHASLEDKMSETENEEKIYALVKDAISNFQLNGDIKEELEFYKETGRVLGNMPELANLKLKQEVYDMNEAELVQQRINAKKSISKYKNKKDKKELHSAWSYKLELIEKRLKEEFKHNLK